MTLTRTALILLLAIAARLVLAGLQPVTDPTEGRYAQVAAEMSASGDWVTPRVWAGAEHIPFQGKPPLYFWSAAAAVHAFGSSAFSVRLPSVLAAVGVLSLLLCVLSRYVDAETARLAALATLSSGLFFGMAGGVFVDMLLAFSVAGALLAHFAFTTEQDLRRRRRWSLLVFALLAAGFLTKGPVALVLFGLPVLTWTAYTRSWHLLRDHVWVAGPLLFAAVVVPWFWMAELRTPDSTQYFFINENILRYLTEDYGDRHGNGHVYRRGTALIMLLVSTAPWSLYLFPAARRWLRDRGQGSSRDAALGFFFIAVVVDTLFWCFARQLLVTYMLPIVPIFAVWVVLLMPPGGRARQHLPRLATAVLGVFVLYGFAMTQRIEEIHSTREILERAAAAGLDRGTAARVVFARQTPNSAHFYAPGRLILHPKERAQDTIRRFLTRGGGAGDEGGDGDPLIVVRHKYMPELSAELLRGLVELEAFGEWHLFRPREPERLGLVAE